MKASFAIDNPGSMKATLTATMNVAEWETVCDALKSSPEKEGWPVYQFRRLIGELVDQVSTKLTAEVKLKEDA